MKVLSRSGKKDPIELVELTGLLNVLKQPHLGHLRDDIIKKVEAYVRVETPNKEPF